MKSEKEIINQIRSLREIKPDAEWVSLAKIQVLGHEAIGHKSSLINSVLNLFSQYRIAVAGLLLVSLAGGTVAAAQGALPGEPLYALKKATEKSMAVITGQKDTPAANLQLAAKRLEEINLMSQRNLVKNLSTAFYEYKSAKAAAKKEVAELVRQNPDNAGTIVKEAGLAMKDINTKEKQVYGALGLDQDASNTDDGSEVVSDKTIVESLIKYFKKGSSLSDEQVKDLEEVKKLFDAGDYSNAIDYYLNSTLNK